MSKSQVLDAVVVAVVVVEVIDNLVLEVVTCPVPIVVVVCVTVVAVEVVDVCNEYVVGTSLISATTPAVKTLLTKLTPPTIALSINPTNLAPTTTHGSNTALAMYMEADSKVAFYCNIYITLILTFSFPPDGPVSDSSFKL